MPFDRLTTSDPSAGPCCPLSGEQAGTAGRGLAEPTPIGPEDLLHVGEPKRMVLQMREGPELVLYYGDQEISFDEPDLFGFAQGLKLHRSFRAAEAAGWGEGTDWPRVAPLLAALVEAGVVRHGPAGTPPLPVTRERPNPLPPATADRARTWSDCAAITAEIAGRAVDPGLLELVVPVFRVAHPALDADGRQVGEANVFPRALRIDTKTDWLACTYEGTRYLSDRPMNATALKAMRAHWPQMMAALLHVRRAFLAREPRTAVDGGWTLGDAERLAVLVLAIPTYALERADGAVPNGSLHPVLSSLFRVTDGLRMVLHQMMFTPVGEPVRAAESRVDVDLILDYAERNYSFHSETGVCAGPRLLVREFLETLLHGATEAKYGAVAFDAAVDAALAAIPAAFDYGLLALRAHAVAFSLWPEIARTFADLAEIAVAEGPAGGLVGRLVEIRAELDRGTYLGREDWRRDRHAAYDAMIDGIERALAGRWPRLAAEPPAVDPDDLAGRLRAPVAARLRADGAAPGLAAPVADRLARHLVTECTVLARANAAQDAVNASIGRPAASRRYGSADVDLHSRLQGATRPRIRPVTDEMSALLGIALSTDGRSIEIGGASSRALRDRSPGSNPVDVETSDNQRRAS